jgi:hypothetical protein
MQFRVATNGIKFRPERLSARRFLWWRWEKWKPLYVCGPYSDWHTAEFNTPEQAFDAMNQASREQAAKQRGWVAYQERVIKKPKQAGLA